MAVQNAQKPDFPQDAVSHHVGLKEIPDRFNGHGLFFCMSILCKVGLEDHATGTKANNLLDFVGVLDLD